MYSCNLKGIMRYSIIKVKMCLIKRKKQWMILKSSLTGPSIADKFFLLPFPLSC